jgi:hypothetical protein
MEILIIPGWLFLGTIGTAILWWDNVLFMSRLHRRPRQLCPSPVGILIILIGVASGGMTFVASILVLIIDGEMMRGTWWTESVCKWWTRPICNRDDVR